MRSPRKRAAGAEPKQKADFSKLTPDAITAIGPRRAGVLAAGGTTSLPVLLARGAAGVARLLPGTSRTLIERWLETAALLQVDGIDPALAAAMVHGGVKSVLALAEMDLKRLEQVVRRGSRVARVSIYDLAAIQRAACRLADSGIVSGAVLDRTTALPMSGIRVTAGGLSATTGPDGAFTLMAVPAGPGRVAVHAPGRPPLTARISVPRGRVAPLIRFRVRQPLGSPAPERELREGEGRLLWQRKGWTSRIVDRELSDMTEGAYLLVHAAPRRGKVPLVHLNRVLVGRQLLTERVLVPAAQLPAKARKDTVLRLRSGKLEATRFSLADIARRKLTAAVGRMRLRHRGRLPAPLW